ncbi:MAG TPA: GNAT family N-acetyltransferase [Roseomonas sp.]|nr:GNAT family N-acetyltransferase [Roseomonas sp.]
MSLPEDAPASRIRPATAEDIPAITAIYAHHVRHGRASFEIEPPDEAEIRRRQEALLAQDMPYLVLEQDGTVLGYAYAGPYRPRPAYRDTVENSIYVRADQAGHGFGQRLLAALIEACEGRGLRQMVAVVGDSGNTASIGLHRAMGFREVGVLRAVGWKHGQWLDIVLLQRALGPGETEPPVTRA